MAGPSGGDDEVRRRALARRGITPEQLAEAVANIREVTPEEAAEIAAQHPPGPHVEWRTDGSVVEVGVDGAETVLRPSAVEGPDADVHSLDERRRTGGHDPKK